MRRIVISGYYGAANCGDEAILEVAIAELRARLGVVDIHVVSLDPAATTAAHGVAAVAYGDTYRLAGLVRDAALVVSGGGGLFQDHDPVTLPALPDHPSPGIL